MSKNQRPNYFKSDEAKKAAHYKLWIAWLPQFEAKWQGRKTAVYYSYNKRQDNGLQWLKDKAKELRTEFRVAHIYDNISGKLLLVIPGADQTHLNKQTTINDN